MTPCLIANCTHAFCLTCVRKWRSKKVTGDPGNKSCPVCRTKSNFIVPANRHLKGAEKEQAISNYKSNMAAKPCRDFEKSKASGGSRLHCGFADDCFYAHTVDGEPFRFGMGAEEMRSLRSLRRNRGYRGMGLLDHAHLARLFTALAYEDEDDYDDFEDYSDEDELDYGYDDDDDDYAL